MKLNLLATTAVAALLASGGMWAHAQGPAPKQNEKAQVNGQKGPAKQEPLAAKQNRGDEKQAAKDQAAAQPKAAQHAEDTQQKSNAARDQKQPNTAAENQKAEPRAKERDQRNAASGINKGQSSSSTKNKSQAAQDSKKERNAEQKTGEQKATQSKQQASPSKPIETQSKHQADQSKPADKSTTTTAADKAGNASAKSQAAQPQNRNTAQQKNAPASPSANQQTTGNAQTGSTNTASARLSDTDRTKVFSTLKSDRQASNQRLDIQVNVGTRLPPRIHPRPLPRTVVEVLPQYRGFEFVTVRDEIAIVRPGTREVVDVIREPGSSSSYASMSTQAGSTTVHLTDQQRTRLRSEARRFTTSQVSGGGSQCLSLQPVPSFLANENPDMRKYQMLAIGDDIVLVDPQQKKVVDVIH